MTTYDDPCQVPKPEHCADTTDYDSMCRPCRDAFDDALLAAARRGDRRRSLSYHPSHRYVDQHWGR